MKKLTLVLVALLLALACVFAACGKKNDTPTDTDPKPVDNDPAVVEPTVAKEDLVKIAEDLKVAYVENYVDLYSAVVATAIDGAKSEALLKINSASSKEEAQKIADDFIAFLKAQKTTVDELKDLIEKIGDVALADEDAIKEAAAYKKALDAAFAGANAAKKAVLDAYKADEETQETVEAFSARLDALKEAKAIAAAKKEDTIKVKDAAIKAKIDALLDKDSNGKFDTDSVNLQIAAIKKAFTAEDKAFNLDDVNDYEALLGAVNALAGIYEIEADSDAYAEIFDTKTLADAKAILDAAVAADPALVDMKAVVDAAAALEAAAKEARYKEYCFIDKNVPGVEYATKEAALKANVEEENIKEVESAASQGQGVWKNKTAVLKLALKADVDAAKKVKNNLLTRYSAAKLGAYGYGNPGDVVKAAVDLINDIDAAYGASLTAASAAFNAAFTTIQYVDVVPTKEDTIGVWTGFKANPAKSTYKTDLAAEIDDLKATFKKTENGIKLSYPAGLLATAADGDYAVGAYYVSLVNGAPAVKYTAWTYTYELEGKALGASTKFDALSVLSDTGVNGDPNATKAKAAIKWLQKYIGDGDYADKYELVKDYGFAKDLIMVDRDITEVAHTATVEINGLDVKDEATEAVAAKVYSPYTIAKLLVAEQEKIDAAKEEAVAAVKAAALALRTAGEADAITAARDLYDAIEDGSYLNKKLYDDDAAEAYLAVALSAEKVVVFEKTAKDPEVSVKVDDLIKDAEAALAAVKALASASTAAIEAKYEGVTVVTGIQENLNDNDKFVELYDLYIAKAQAVYDAAVAGNAAKLVPDGDVTTAKNNLAKVNAIKNLLLNKVVFDDVNAGDKYVTVKAGASEEATNETNIGAVIDAFAPATSAEITAAMKAALKTQLAKLAAGTKKDRAALTTDLEAAEKSFNEVFDAFKGYAAVDADQAYTDKAAIKNALAKIKTFVDNNKADFINLTYTVSFGEKTLTFEALTEVYRERLLAGNYDVINATLVYANTLDATAKAALHDDDPLVVDTWEATAQTRVKAIAVSIDAVTSIKAADELVKTYALEDGVYELDTALVEINKALKAASKAEIDAKTLKAGIATKAFAW